MKKTFRKVLASLLVAVMLLTAAPLSGVADFDLGSLFGIKASALVSEGPCGESAFWAYDSSNDTVVITGTGTIESSDIRNFDPKNIVIRTGITAIGDSAFSYYTNLTSVTIPSGVTSIGQSAFTGCYNLTDVTIPSGVTSIGEYAFTGCYNLTDVTIPGSVTSIGSEAFRYCTSLTSINIPNGVEIIDYEAFGDCSELTAIVIPKSVTYIGDCAFSNCTKLNDITLPDSLTYIGMNVFYGTAYFNNSLNWDGSGVLYLDNYLIEAEASLTSYSIREGTIAIAGGAFRLTDITDITIPDSVKWIGWRAFDNCISLKNITIPNSVTSIGDAAFVHCFNMTSAAIPESVKYIGASAFDGCPNLRSIKIPNDVTSIEQCAFSGCAALESIIIPDGVVSVGDGAFEFCSGLTSITIPKSVTSIGRAAFHYCSELKDIYYAGTEQEWDVLMTNTEAYNAPLLDSEIHFNHDHSFRSETVTPATCTTDGVIKHTCTHGETFIEVVPPIEHSFGKWTVAVKPTASIDGVLERRCEECDFVEKNTIRSTSENGIKISSTSENIFPGKTVTLTAHCTSGDKPLVWSSYDSDIAVVENGVITAKNLGSTVIAVRTASGEKSFCYVRVIGIKALANTDAVVDSDKNMIYGLAPHLKTLEDYVKVTADELAIEYDSQSLGTGSAVNILQNGEAADSYEIVIFGDVNGDGVYDGMDAVIVNCMANGMLTREQVGEAAYTAADCNHDGTIDANDVKLLEQAGLLLAQVDQSKSEEELLQTSSAYIEYLDLIDQSVEPNTTEPAEEEPVDQVFAVSFLDMLFRIIMRIVSILKSAFVIF